MYNVKQKQLPKPKLVNGKLNNSKGIISISKCF